MQETEAWNLGGEDPLEKETATHSSTLAWNFPWKEEPGGLQSMESQKSWTCLSDGTNAGLHSSMQYAVEGRPKKVTTGRVKYGEWGKEKNQGQCSGFWLSICAITVTIY